MKFVDLSSEYNYFKPEIDKAVFEVLSSGHYLLGPKLETLETIFPKEIGMNYGVGVKNCTDAIMMLVKNLITKTTPVILPNFGAYPTAVAANNFTKNIYYVDVDETLTIDTNKLPNIKNGIIIPVHLFGNNCNMEAIKDYATVNNHIIIEDCAQSTGSGSGCHGDYSVFSFYPTKPLASMGDGGMICSNKDLAFYKEFRFYGQNKNTIETIGINSRMDEIQAGIVNTKIGKYKELNHKRIEICERYKKNIKGMKTRGNCVFHQFPVLFKNRELIIDEMSKIDIPYIIHYKQHVSEIPALTGIYNKVENRICDNIISFPCHPFLSELEIQKIEEFLYKHQKDEK